MVRFWLSPKTLAFAVVIFFSVASCKEVESENGGTTISGDSSNTATQNTIRGKLIQKALASKRNSKLQRQLAELLDDGTVVGAHSARIVDGNRLQFPSLKIVRKDQLQQLSAILELTYDEKKKGNLHFNPKIVFVKAIEDLKDEVKNAENQKNWGQYLKDLMESLRKKPTSTPPQLLELSLNGVPLYDRPTLSLTPISTWSHSKSTWAIDLTNTAMANGKTFYQNLYAIAAAKGRIEIEVRTTGTLKSAKLVFFLKPNNPEPELTASIDEVIPSETTTEETSVIFHFSGSTNAVSYECAFDTTFFSACQSPIAYSELSAGMHNFQVRSLSASGATSAVASYSFTVSIPTLSVDIVSASPAGNTIGTNSLTIDFTATSGTTTSCNLDDAGYVPCTSPLQITNLADGAHSLMIQAKSIKNGKNVSAPATYAWVVDTTAPLVGLDSAPEQMTNLNEATFAFHSNEPTTMQCSLDDGSMIACSSPVTLNVSEGTHKFVVMATDYVGNVSEAATFSWTVDQTAPVVALDGVSPSSAVTNVDSMVASFSASETATFTCSVDGITATDCTSPLEITELAEGFHTFTIFARDVAGNVGQKSYSWTTDYTRPIVTLNLLAPANLISNETSATIEMVSTDDFYADCTFDGVAVEACETTMNFAGLADGTHTFQVQVYDGAGNASDLVTQSWTVDTAPPVISITSVQPSDATTDNTSLTMAFTANESADFRCQLNQGGFVPCSSPYAVNGLTDGMHTIDLMARDAAGNDSTAASYQWTIQTTALATLTSISPQTSPTSSRNAAFEFTGTGAGFVCSLDGAPYATCSSPMSFSNLEDGEHAFTVKATGAHGNVYEGETYTWFIDATAPVAHIDTMTPPHSPTAQTTMSLAFSANETSTFMCKLDGGAYDHCASPFVMTNVSAGSHTASIYAMDSVGNMSQPVTYSWVVHNTALVISDVIVSNVTRNSAVVTWTTNLASDSQVKYGEGNTNSSTSVDGNRVTTHSVTLTGLKSFTLYNIKARSVDIDGRATESAVFQFRTLR